jgi:hypothetical protein
MDQTVLIYDAAPISKDDFLGLVAEQFGLAEPPPRSSEREANGQLWTLYETEAQGYPIDFALAEGDGVTNIVLLISHADEHDALYQDVFLPAVEALEVLE